MAVTIETIETRDPNYASKVASNFAALKAAVDALQAQTQGTASTAINLPRLYAALFGAGAAVIGAGSYECTVTGQVVNVAAGFAWLPTLGTVVQLAAPGSVDLTGQADGTYYIRPDASGTPTFSTSSSGALYSVVKTGTNLAAPVRVAAVTWADADWQAAQASSRLGSFLKLDDRLEAIEASAVSLFVTGAFVSGKPGNAALMFAILPTTTATFAAAFAGSRAKAGVAATAQTVLSIKKNGVQVGTITFAASGTTGTFAAAAQTVVGVGDELTIENQATADATLADIRFALHGTR